MSLLAMDSSRQLCVILLVIYVCTFNKVEGGWTLHQKGVTKKSCSSYYWSKSTFRPPLVDTCLSYCSRKGRPVCEFAQIDGVGYCYAKPACTKLMESTSNIVLDIYFANEGTTQAPSQPTTPKPAESTTQPGKTSGSKGTPAQTRDPSRPLTLKLGLLVASDLADAFYSLYRISNTANKEAILKTQILTNYITGVNTVFADKSIGDVNIKIVPTYLSIVPETTWGKWSDIYQYCSSSYQTSIPNVDAVIYLVKRNGESAKKVELTSSGRAITGGLCKVTSRCGIVSEVASLDTGYKKLISHELGHIIGQIDDGYGLASKLRRSSYARRLRDNHQYPYDDMRCVSQDVKSVMSAGAEVWSVCNKDRFKTIFGSDLSHCLDTPATSPLLPKASNLIGNVKEFSREAICGMARAQTPSEPQWSVIYQKPAAESDCKFAEGECSLKAPPRADGGWSPRRTMSGAPFSSGIKCSKGICYFGECLSKDEISAKVKTFIG